MSATAIRRASAGRRRTRRSAAGIRALLELDHGRARPARWPGRYRAHRARRGLAGAVRLGGGHLAQAEARQDARRRRCHRSRGFTLDAYETGPRNAANVLLWTCEQLPGRRAGHGDHRARSPRWRPTPSRATLFRGRRVLHGVTVAAVMVPPQMLIVPLFRADADVRPGGHVSPAMILPQVVAPDDGVHPEAVLRRDPAGAARRRPDRRRVGSWRCSGRSCCRCRGSILAAVSIFVFIGAWNNFLWPFIVTNDPGS